MALDKQPSQREIDGMLQHLEQRIDTLKKRYERYFLGIEQRPPVAMRKQVVREVFELEQTYIGNTAQRFRLRSLVQRFNTHKTRWNRIMRQIEQGTYHRDRKRAERRKRQRGAPEEKESKDQAFEVDPEADYIDDLQDADLDAIFDGVQNDGADSPPAQSQPSQPDVPATQKTAAEKERIKQQRLAEIQRQLGMSPQQSGADAPSPSSQPSPAKNPSPPAQPAASNQTSAQDSSGSKQKLSTREQKLAAMREKLNRDKKPAVGRSSHRSSTSQAAKSPAKDSASSTKASSSRERKLEKLRSKLSREKSRKKHRNIRRSSSNKTSSGKQRRVVRRSSGDDGSGDSARRVYEDLVEAKKRCNQPTDNLTYESVKRSMDKQRKTLQKKRGARNVDFDVVIKDGQAYLKPDPKD